MRNDNLRNSFTVGCLSGKGKMSLAITEAFGGSAVADLRTTAEKTANGSRYRIDGTKKRAINDMFSADFVVGCKTVNGFSMILESRYGDVNTKKM
jgi:alkylation response protein AidB-like acyl-CoA dehydrogenase